jgi:hypothetical protein
MPSDIIRGEILPDGTIKSYTDEISDANHSKAADFFKILTDRTGGPMVATARHGEHHVHQHDLDVEHEHE